MKTFKRSATGTRGALLQIMCSRRLHVMFFQVETNRTRRYRSDFTDLQHRENKLTEFWNRTVAARGFRTKMQLYTRATSYSRKLPEFRPNEETRRSVCIRPCIGTVGKLQELATNANRASLHTQSPLLRRMLHILKTFKGRALVLHNFSAPMTLRGATYRAGRCAGTCPRALK
jgi:hypothetical protein